MANNPNRNRKPVLSRLVVVLAMTLAVAAVGVPAAPAADLPEPDPGADATYGTVDGETTEPDVAGVYEIPATVEIAAVGGAGADAANIQCIWELVDLDRPFLGNSRAPDLDSWEIDPPDTDTVGQLDRYFMDYAWDDPASGAVWFDDVLESLPDGVPVLPNGTADEPCFENVPGSPALGAEYTSGTTNVIQVYANAGDATGPGADGIFGTGDDPDAGTPAHPTGERVIEVWAAVDGPGNNVSEISQVFWDVDHPDGTRKIQIHDVDGLGQQDCFDGPTNELGVGTTDPFDPSTFAILDDNSVFGAAVGTRQMTFEAAHAIVQQCAQNRKKLYRSHFTLSKHQPCGPYHVTATSVAASGEQEVRDNYFTVLCFIHLDLDFTAITWPGPLQPTDTTLVDGDFTLDPADGRPTAINAGSGALVPVVDFYPLVDASNKKIVTFDLQFGVNPFGGLVTATDPDDGDPVIRWGGGDVSVPERADLPETPVSTLCANETGKFVFSIHTENASAGTYTGVIDISAMAATDLTTCNNTDGVWGGYHAFGADGEPDGGGPGVEADPLPDFDDDYGRNQRDVINP